MSHALFLFACILVSFFLSIFCSFHPVSPSPGSAPAENIISSAYEGEVNIAAEGYPLIRYRIRKVARLIDDFRCITTASSISLNYLTGCADSFFCVARQNSTLKEVHYPYPPSQGTHCQSGLLLVCIYVGIKQNAQFSQIGVWTWDSTEPSVTYFGGLHYRHISEWDGNMLSYTEKHTCHDPPFYSTVFNKTVKATYAKVIARYDCLAFSPSTNDSWNINTDLMEFVPSRGSFGLNLAGIYDPMLADDDLLAHITEFEYWDEAFYNTDTCYRSNGKINITIRPNIFTGSCDAGADPTSIAEIIHSFPALGFESQCSLYDCTPSFVRVDDCTSRNRLPDGDIRTFPQIAPPKRRERGFFDGPFAWVEDRFDELTGDLGRFTVKLLDKIGGFLTNLPDATIQFLQRQLGEYQKRLSYLLSVLILFGIAYVQPSVLLVPYYWVFFGVVWIRIFSGGFYAEALEIPTAEVVCYDVVTLTLILSAKGLVTLERLQFLILLVYLGLAITHYQQRPLKAIVKRVPIFFSFFLPRSGYISCGAMLIMLLVLVLEEPEIVSFIRACYNNLYDVFAPSGFPIKHSTSFMSVLVGKARIIGHGKRCPVKARPHANITYSKRYKNLFGSVFYREERYLIEPYRLILDTLDLEKFRYYSLPATSRFRGELDWLRGAILASQRDAG